MNRFKEIFPKIAIGLFAAVVLFLVGVGIYTPFTENSYFYNLGYITGLILSPIAYAIGYAVGYIKCLF